MRSVSGRPSGRWSSATHRCTTALATTNVEGLGCLSVALLLLLLVENASPEAVEVLAVRLVILGHDNVLQGTALLPDLGVSEGSAAGSLLSVREWLGAAGEERLDVLLRVVDRVRLGLLVIEDGLGSVL